MSARSEVGLIAPEEIRRLLAQVANARRDYVPGSKASTPEGSYPALQGRLIRAMRADLGEPEE
jgi:hypothetical protein